MAFTSRTITRGETSLTLPEPGAVTLSFFENGHSVIKITVPPTSTWKMNYHWHKLPDLCERIDFLPGGDVELYRSLGVYRNSTISGRAGMHWQNRPGERCTWFLNSHRDHPAGSPDLEAFVQSPGNEEMWRNVVSCILDNDLWPELRTTPLLCRLWIRLVKMLPVVGTGLSSRIMRVVLWVQLLLIYKRHGYWVWCGHIPICKLWKISLRPDLPPQWAQDAQWKSADLLTKLSMNFAVLLSPILGLQDGYLEYYNATTQPAGVKDIAS